VLFAVFTQKEISEMFNFDWLTPEQIELHSLDMRQFVDFRQSTLPNGMRLVEAYNASGLNYTILPDRGFDIWTAHYRGVPLTWVAQGSPFPPDHGARWLRQFNGGLLTTCGLTHAGVPETDPNGEQRDLHGLYTRLRAREVAVSGAWQDGSYVLELKGAVAEAILFGEQLLLERTYRLWLDKPVIQVEDRVTNTGDLPTPLMVLYHINLGYPLISAHTVLHTPHAAVYSRDAEAEKGYGMWPQYAAAIPRYAEQVYWHHLKTDTSGQTTVALLQEAFGLQFEWDANQLPYLTQWKNVREGIYVCGVEPGNCLPEGRNGARDAGRLVTLEPGAIQHFAFTLTVLDGANAVAAVRERIAGLQASGTPVASCDLHDYAE
jgi:galactose mutarotase-like enzyme